MPENKTFSNTLITWYNHHKRDLPWRHDTSPYSVWISEIILQQTRVNQGISYYNHFLEHYPTIQDLASANEEEILRSWQGLGYYSRARNLHFAAKQIVETYDGTFPNSYLELKKLKGVGEYTAAAIASFCFKEITPVIDGNVFRVLARIFGIHDDISTPRSRKVFLEKATELISHKHPDTFNQAIMEFGALHCTPKKPQCNTCPFSHQCHAFNNQTIEHLPIKIKKTKVRNRYFHYFLLQIDDATIMQKRLEGDIWQHLYEPYLVETESEDDDPKQLLLQNKINFKSLKRSLKPIKHILSHQRIFAFFHQVELDKESLAQLNSQYKLYTPSEINSLPKPILVANYLSKNNF